MEKYLFKRGTHMYKANLHGHTTQSDGAWTPEHMKAQYKAKGYQVIAFTDHDVLKNHAYLNDDAFLAINACEVGIAQRLPAEPAPGQNAYTRKVYHFNLYATDPHITQTPPLMTMAYEDIEAINQYIKDRTDEGFLVCYNHPYWSLQTYADYSRLKGCFAMEIYNHGCEVSDGYYGYNPQAYDEMLRCQNKIYCLSTDDNHNAPHNPYGDSFGGYTLINSPGLSYPDVINALKQGDFYATQGPEIHEIALNGSQLRIKCSEVCLLVVYTDGRNCYIKKGEPFTDATFTLRGHEQYIRVMCRDAHHKDANSNAYWL